MSNPFNDYHTRLDFMRHSIQAASIVRQAHDKISQGLGQPDEEDMKRYQEQAADIGELWLKVTNGA